MKKTCITMLLVVNATVFGAATDIKYGTSWTQNNDSGKGGIEDTFTNIPQKDFFAVYDGAAGDLVSNVLANGSYDGKQWAGDGTVSVPASGSLAQAILDKKDTLAIGDIFNQYEKKLQATYNLSKYGIDPKVVKNEKKPGLYIRNQLEKKGVKKLKRTVKSLMNDFKSLKDDSTYISLDGAVEGKDGEVSTATVVLIDQNNIKIAWVGDSQGLIVKNDGTHWITSEHNLANKQEQDRIEKLLKDRNNIAGLNDLSRRKKLIEDTQTKDSVKKIASYWQGAGHSRHFSLTATNFNAGVIAEPEVKAFGRKNVGFMVLASDGLWDKVTPEEVKNLVQNVLSGKKIQETLKPKTRSGDVGNDEGAKKAAHVLRNLARERGSRDDITVTVIFLNNSTPSAKL